MINVYNGDKMVKYGDNRYKIVIINMISLMI